VTSTILTWDFCDLSLDLEFSQLGSLWQQNWHHRIPVCFKNKTSRLNELEKCHVKMYSSAWNYLCQCKAAGTRRLLEMVSKC